MNKFQIEQLAQQFRVRNGMNDKEAIRFRSLLSELNVITIFKPLKGNFSGMAIKIYDEQYKVRLMLVNSNHTKAKQHFTICHELYHLYIQENFTSASCSTGLFDKKDIEEFHADLFAAHLILPEVGVKGLIPNNELGPDKIKLQTILKIEHYYSCSRASLLYRLKQLKLISKAKYDEFSKNVKRSAIAYGYSLDLYEPANYNLVLGDYGVLAKELYDKEKISETHYFSLLKDLGMNSDKLNQLSNASEEG